MSGLMAASEAIRRYEEFWHSRPWLEFEERLIAKYREVYLYPLIDHLAKVIQELEKKP